MAGHGRVVADGGAVLGPRQLPPVRGLHRAHSRTARPSQRLQRRGQPAHSRRLLPVFQGPPEAGILAGLPGRHAGGPAPNQHPQPPHRGRAHRGPGLHPGAPAGPRGHHRLLPAERAGAPGGRLRTAGRLGALEEHRGPGEQRLRAVRQHPGRGGPVPGPSPGPGRQGRSAPAERAHRHRRHPQRLPAGQPGLRSGFRFAGSGRSGGGDRAGNPRGGSPLLPAGPAGLSRGRAVPVRGTPEQPDLHDLRPVVHHPDGLAPGRRKPGWPGSAGLQERKISRRCASR